MTRSPTGRYGRTGADLPKTQSILKGSPEAARLRSIFEAHVAPSAFVTVDYGEIERRALGLMTEEERAKAMADMAAYNRRDTEATVMMTQALAPPNPPLYPVGTEVTFFWGGYHLPITGKVESICDFGNFWLYTVVDETGSEFEPIEEEHLSIAVEQAATVPKGEGA